MNDDLLEVVVSRNLGGTKVRLPRLGARRVAHDELRGRNRRSAAATHTRGVYLVLFDP